MQQRILIISAVHDYRMKRRGSIQAIADAFRDEGSEVTFLSIRFSPMSRFKRDPRQDLAARANIVEQLGSIRCFLWRTPFHPFGTRNLWLNFALTPLFWIYASWPSRALDGLIRQSNLIIIESGLGVLLIGRIKKISPNAKVIYRASDRLSTISQHPAVGRALVEHQKLFAHFGLLGPGMAPDFVWAYPKAYIVPPGLDRSYVGNSSSNPYPNAVNAVSLGPMLFDRNFFEQAAPLFPEVMFHIFGVVDPPMKGPANVVYHPEIPYAETAAYVRHASFGVAAYRQADEIGYLADTSSKLLQYAAFGLPAVCPFAVVGRHKNRFGYQPGDAASIKAAIVSALGARRQEGSSYKTWQDIVPRLVAPAQFDDVKLQGPLQPIKSDGAADPETLSLIVATRGRRDPLRRLLSSLQSQTSDAFETIVVDQNPPGYLDDIIALFSDKMKILTIRCEPGLSLARNRGLAASKGSTIAFPDDDCWYPPSLVDDALRFFSVYPEYDVMLGQTIDESGYPSLNPARKFGGPVTPYNIWFSGNSNTLFIRGRLARSLQFQESLGVGASSPYQSGEETDFVLQSMDRGSRAVYCPNFTVFHEQVDDELNAKQFSRAWRYAGGFGRVMRTRYSVGYAGYRICRTFAGATVSLLTGQPRRAAYKAVWGAGTIRGWLF